MRTRSSKIIGLLLAGADILVLAAAFMAAYGLRLRLDIFRPVQPLSDYVLFVVVVLASCLIFFQQQGLYRDVRDLSMLEEYAKIIKGLTYSVLLALALTFFFKWYERSRVLVVLFWGTSLVLLITARYFSYRLLKHVRRRGWNQLNIALVGSEKKIKAVRHLLKTHPQLGYHVAVQVILPRDTGTQSDALRKKINQELLPPYQRGEIAGVIISDTVKNYEQILEVKEIFDEYRLPHRDVTEDFDLTGFKNLSSGGLDSLLASLGEGQVSGAYKVAKRFIDEVVSLSVLLLTAPLWLLIMLAIKLDSPGPVFFRQERVGYLGKRFYIYKFRSMYTEAPKYAKTPNRKNDPRITRVGRWLRSTSLDELPQLINVIKGDMSLVGPRPEMPFMLEKYKSIYRYRLLVLPGLTGLWQVSGRTDKPLEENIKYDLYYIKNISLLLDLVILLRTVPAVFAGRGAY